MYNIKKSEEWNKWYEDLFKTSDFENPLLKSLYDYYLLNDTPVNELLAIITSNSKISIRVLDWFVTNYSKKYNIIYNTKTDTHFNVYLQYKLHLRGYGKKFCDPFCRKGRIIFYYDMKKSIITTIGQLNFFRWAISNNILDYVSNNLQNICDDMNNATKVYIKNLKNNNITNDSNITTESNNSNQINDDSNINSIDSELSDDTIILSNTLNTKINKLVKHDIHIKEKKRHELSYNKNKNVNKINMDILINFD